ncbi:MAG: ArsR/SmtB family transcription factor [Planctomycetota bacterium]
MTEEEFRGARMLAALSNVIRFRIVLLLDEGRMTPSDLADALGRTVPRISHHLGILRAADVVRFKVTGGRHFYWLKVPAAAKICRQAVDAGKQAQAVRS